VSPSLSRATEAETGRAPRIRPGAVHISPPAIPMPVATGSRKNTGTSCPRSDSAIAVSAMPNAASHRRPPQNRSVREPDESAMNRGYARTVTGRFAGEVRTRTRTEAADAALPR
jgi:hypothetical protein